MGPWSPSLLDLSSVHVPEKSVGAALTAQNPTIKTLNKQRNTRDLFFIDSLLLRTVLLRILSEFQTKLIEPSLRFLSYTMTNAARLRLQALARLVHPWCGAEGVAKRRRIYLFAPKTKLKVNVAATSLFKVLVKRNCLAASTAACRSSSSPLTAFASVTS